MTNREWLNKLTDEELATLISNISICDQCEYNCDDINQYSCKDGIIKWLKKEHNDNEWEYYGDFEYENKEHK